MALAEVKAQILHLTLYLQLEVVEVQGELVVLVVLVVVAMEVAQARQGKVM
jgi:uncharacterized membrane protein YqjE